MRIYSFDIRGMFKGFQDNSPTTNSRTG